MSVRIERTRLLVRIALLAALCYVTSLATFVLPNVKLLFFLIFSSGFLWGAGAGVLVGIIGLGLWTSLNPFGPVMLPIALAQVAGGVLCGLVGAFFSHVPWRSLSKWVLALLLIGVSIVVTLAFYLPVNIVDAWFMQPFWPRLWLGMTWTLPAFIANALIFPLLFPVITLLYDRECAHAV